VGFLNTQIDLYVHERAHLPHRAWPVSQSTQYPVISVCYGISWYLLMRQEDK
jgi:hypothetical protein